MLGETRINKLECFFYACGTSIYVRQMSKMESFLLIIKPCLTINNKARVSRPSILPTILQCVVLLSNQCSAWRAAALLNCRQHLMLDSGTLHDLTYIAGTVLAGV